VSYDRELEWNEPPAHSEHPYARWTVVRAAGPPAAAWWPLARIGAVDLYVAPPGHERDAPAVSITPLVAAKRGRRGSGDYAGVDGHVQTEAFEAAAAAVAMEASALASAPPSRPARARRTRAIRVAVVDVSFDELAALPLARVEGPMHAGLPGGVERAAAALPSCGPGHGTQMAGVVLAEFPGARVGLFQIPGNAGAARPYLAPADLAAAVAAAVGSWHADVVLIAMSDGAWGTPSYLRDVLREAARCGRRGRGAAIFCSVGDPSRNHARQDDSAALGADDLASQPWVHAIAACDRRGRWYRVYPGYECPGSEPGLASANDPGPANINGATYNRLGPAVALAALGEPHRWSEHIASDDSSQASAVAAAAAGRVLDENRDLTVAELRALLALTADVPSDVDGGAGLAAGTFDARDRLGHSLKIGHGVVNPRAACLAAADPVCLALLATRAVPDSEPGSPEAASALALARAWQAEIRLAARRGDPLARAYARVAGRVSRLFLTSLPVQEALCWLARHVRALAETARWSVWRKQHHGALVERIRHTLDTVRDALGSGDGAAAAFLAQLESALARAEAGDAVATVLARTLGPAVIAADGGQGEPRALALTSDAVGDRHRRRGSRRAGGGGDMGRRPFSGPSVPRPVHRSTR